MIMHHAPDEVAAGNGRHAAQLTVYENSEIIVAGQDQARGCACAAAFEVSDSAIMDEVHHLKQLLRNVIVDGDFGLTLRTGKVTVAHTVRGPKRLEAVLPTEDDIAAFLRQLTGSRGVREFRESGVTRFIVPFENGVRLVGAARLEKDDIHVEIRRMAGESRRVGA